MSDQTTDNGSNQNMNSGSNQTGVSQSGRSTTSGSGQGIEQIVQQAVGQSFDQWAAQHPALAAVIDRVRVTNLTVTSLRNSAEYRQAVADYTQGVTELNLLAQLMNLAGPIIAGLLA